MSMYLLLCIYFSHSHVKSDVAAQKHFIFMQFLLLCPNCCDFSPILYPPPPHSSLSFWWGVWKWIKRVADVRGVAQWLYYHLWCWPWHGENPCPVQRRPCNYELWSTKNTFSRFPGTRSWWYFSLEMPCCKLRRGKHLLKTQTCKPGVAN